ncbi:FAD-dependent oxidoreductase [Pulveribacter suum]|uniref:Amino acid dehydrogenase n=1 Tax=Pulveribacter suum TaxID=2116657 RepID=A0A2P1NLQ2_9BURK|nr:FAD-dependent oxidoreductase [Pulveribacter suum]AVP57950.1 amino acid dehydrogenase [Pulveribacter suum]
MHIIIVGAGIVGTATAYELACDGHEVTVVEQRAAAAEQASFASAGLLAPSLLIPWAAPGADGRLARRMLGSRAALRLVRGAGLAGMAWLWRWRQAGRDAGAGERLLALAALGQASLARTRAIAHDLDVDSESSPGTLMLLRSRAEVQLAQPALQALAAAGVPVREVDADTARLIEPGLAPEAPLAGALHAPEGGAANCRLFAQLLRQAAQERGARFLFNARVQALATGGPGVHLVGQDAPLAAGAVVLCAGMASAALLRPLGVRLPLAGMHGYSVTAPLREESHAPQGAVIDPQHRVTITRQGQRVRVSGGAELAEAGGAHDEATLRTLYLALSGWFPGGALVSSSQVQVWRGARPTLPDGAPVIGAGPAPGLWLNTGHGACGWAHACGSARMLADLLGGREPGLDTEPFALARF